MVTREATRTEEPLTHEVRLEIPGGRAIEQMIVVPNGSQRRIYFIGMAGKELDLDGPEVQRLFESFRRSE